MAFKNFFHDSQTLELAIERALPTLCGQAFIHIWNAGCAQASEAYTLAMLLREEMPEFAFRNVRIFATDGVPQFDLPAASGVYSEQEVKRIPYPIRYRCFQVTDEPGYVQVVDEIRSKISFARHDLLSFVPPHEDFSLIVCKNPLLHFDEMECGQVVRMFHRSLRPDGLLSLENARKMPEILRSLFEPISNCARIYRRLDSAESTYRHIDGSHPPLARMTREHRTSPAT